MLNQPSLNGPAKSETNARVFGLPQLPEREARGWWQVKGVRDIVSGVLIIVAIITARADLWWLILGRGTHSGPLRNDRDESECGEIVSGQTVVSCCQAPPVLEAAEEALDEVATSIDCAIERVRNSPRCGGWNDGFDAAVSKPVAQAIRVIGLVCDQMFRRRDGAQQRHGHADIGDIAGRQREGDRSAAIIGQTMDFRGAPSARATDRLRPLPPFAPAAERCAFTCELSRLSS